MSAEASNVAQKVVQDRIGGLLAQREPVGREQGASLTAAWFESPLGPMLAVSDERALLLLEFWERRGLLEAIERLARSAAVAPGRTAPIESAERQLAEYFGGRRRTFDTPLDMQGSEFRLRVWNELLRIEPGRTLTYLELSHAVGDPKAIRAVAQANGANRFAVMVPCHRVIGSDGGLGGYAAGLERKRWLLDHEQANFGSGQGRLF